MPATAIIPTGAVWNPGQTVVAVSAVCCPRCGTISVQYRGPRSNDALCAWWECYQCGERWKMPREIGKTIVRI